jgi:hypothetical protein
MSLLSGFRVKTELNFKGVVCLEKFQIFGIQCNLLGRFVVFAGKLQMK